MWLTIELDTFARSLPRRWLSWGDHHGRFAELGFVYARTGNGQVELAIGPDGRRFLSAFHRSVAAVVEQGISVVCEGIVYDDEDWRDWTAALADVPTCWVRLTAPLSILESRERAERSEASQGLARGMTARSLAGKYDLEIDTGAEAIAASVQRVANWLWA